MNKVYFPGLNGIRFLAFLMVLVHHVEQCKGDFRMPHAFKSAAIFNIGGLGVTLFFVLSGFLITYLLLVEKEKTSTIRVRHFYARRILRIWPLYYLLVLLGFFVLPRFFYLPWWVPADASGFYPKLACFVFFVPNLAQHFFSIVPFVAHLWSIGVEEQFYLVWPLLVKRFGRRFWPCLVWVIVFMIGLRKFLEPKVIGLFWTIDPNVLKETSTFLMLFRIDCMAIGGLAAYALHTRREALLNVLFDRRTQLVMILVLLFSLVCGVRYPVDQHAVYSLLFAGILLNVSANPKSLIRLDNGFMNYMGRISYGLYMWHALCIVIVLTWIKKGIPGLPAGIQVDWLIYGAAFLLTTAIASLSYFLIEKPFLNLKNRFSPIATGDNARELSPTTP